jgi:catechol 2,3-dioxygenase-like lactoylglutathione lyase family enzyme
MPPLVDHVDLVVCSLERSLPFYKGLLGAWGEVYDNVIQGERGEEVHYMGVPGGGVAVGLRERQTDGDFDRYRLGVHHLCFAAGSREQVDERAAWLREQDAQIESGPGEYEYSEGYYAVFFHDPDGMKLEIAYIPD